MEVKAIDESKRLVFNPKTLIFGGDCILAIIFRECSQESKRSCSTNITP
jgi:hypothetical protein